MIREDEIFKIGKLIKPHGIKGEIAFSVDNDIFDRVECPYLVCKVDGIFVPFFIKEHRFKGQQTALVMFEDINNETKALRLSGVEVYFPRKYYEEIADEGIEYTWSYFVGFKAIDKKHGELGTIEQIDDTTMNTLFIITNGEEEFLLPATEEFIEKIDSKNKTIYFNLIDGLIE